MTSLQDALKERGITKVVIVDDCIDEVPLANDLTDVDAAWANFHDDWDDDIEAAIQTEYDGDLAEPFDLRNDDAYIGALWKTRPDLGEGIKPVFEGYQSKQRYDLKAIDQLDTHLTKLGLTVERHGRDFVDPAKQADLIVIDLFLGAAQDANASRLSKKRLSEIVADKQADMPPVLLFSNSTRLSENRESYRDEANLLESGFRILRKDELETPEPLHRQLERLAEKRDETRLLASFLIALERSLAEASHSTLTMMRGLGLSEMAQIRQLLLEFEGRPLGGYLVDVFDRVLQHEIESQEDIIEAARKLDTFGENGSGPPYISGQMQFQHVVKRMTTQATERLRLGGSPEFPLTFGDVLLKCAAAPITEAAQAAQGIGEVTVQPEAAPGEPTHSFTAEEIANGDLFLAVTAGCDLARGAAESILFLKGKAEPISEENWLYRGVRSPAVELDGALCRIDWDLTKYETMRLDEATARYFDGSLARVARLRDQHAVEIQQKFLASLGRVGLPAHLPASVPIEVRAYYYSETLNLTALVTPEIESESRCFVGRDKNSNQRASVVLSESGCDQLLGELDKIDLNNVAENARRSFEVLKSTNALYEILKDGIEVTNLNPGSKVVRKVASKHGELSAITLVWNGQALDDQVASNYALAKGLILTVGTRED